MSGGKVELDEVTVPAPLLENSSSQKPVPVTSTPISEEVNDDDHETSDQVAIGSHQESPPKPILCSHTWILSQISWPQAIYRNLGS